MTVLSLDLCAARLVVPGTILHRVELPAVTSTQLAFYCAAIRVADPIHYDRNFALRFGFRDLVVNGSLRIAWLTHALADLVEPPNHVGHLACTHRGPMFAGDALTLEVRATAALKEADLGRELRCQVMGKVDDKIIDQAEGALVFVGD